MNEFERLSYFRIDRGKANTVKPGDKAIWRKFENVTLPNDDQVGVVTAWSHPGKDAPSEMTHKAKSVFLALLDRFAREGRVVNDRTGSNNAAHVFSQEPEAKRNNLNKYHLRAAMRALFEEGTIRSETYGKEANPHHKLVRT